MRLASIDIGTNSTRLLVADCDGRRTRTVERLMRITRLGEGVDKKHELVGEAMERTLAALREYAEVMDSQSRPRIGAVATSALRDCRNSAEFLDAAEQTIGVRPQVVTGALEAALSYVGAVSDLTSELTVDEGLLVFDIGGGSTELMTAIAPPSFPLCDGGWLRSRSVDVGCVRMSERYLSSDPPSPISIGRLESFLVAKLKPAVSSVAPAGVKRAVGLAGTVTTVSALKLGLEEYDTEAVHHSSVTRADVEEIFKKLAAVDVEERKRIMVVESGRADVIVGGVAVLRAVMDVSSIDELLVSEKDILDGIVLDLYARSEGEGADG